MHSLPQAYGRYRLLAPLGLRLDAEIFRGALPGIGGYEKPVVIRRLPEAQANQPDAVARFVRRAEAAAAVNHPNAVPVFEVGSGPAGEPFMVEGWVPGPSLASLLRTVNGARQRLPTWFALHVAGEVLAALVHGAEQGVAHGALAAEDVRLSYDGEIRVTGFGQRAEADDHRAVRRLLVDEMSVSSATVDLPRVVRPWLAGDEDGDLWRCLQWVKEARTALRARVTAAYVSAALAQIEADALGWEAPPGRATPATPVEVRAEDEGPGIIPLTVRKAPRRLAPPATFDAASASRPARNRRSRSAPTEPDGRAPQRAANGRPSAPPAPLAARPRGRPTSATLADLSDLREDDPTDPGRVPLVDVGPTMELQPGRRGDVQIWLQAPPTVVGPRHLDEGVRLIQALGDDLEGLSLSVDGHRFRPLPRVARQLGEPLAVPDGLQANARVQGVLADASALQVIGARARARATGRLTFVRHDASERVTLELVDGRLVGALATSATLAAWAQLLSDEDLPAGMAVRAFAVVVSEDQPISQIGSPLMNTALTQARATQAEAQLLRVLSWSWAHYAFVPGPEVALSDRVTDVPLLPRLFEWLTSEVTGAVLLARLAPYMNRAVERADDFDAVLSRLRVPARALVHAAGLGHGEPLRDSMARSVSLKHEPEALAMAYMLLQLGVLIPA